MFLNVFLCVIPQQHKIHDSFKKSDEKKRVLLFIKLQDVLDFSANDGSYAAILEKYYFFSNKTVLYRVYRSSHDDNCTIFHAGDSYIDDDCTTFFVLDLHFT